MGFSGGGSSAPSTTTTVNKSEPPKYLEPYLIRSADAATNLYNNGGGFSYFPGNTVAPFSNQTQQALDLTQQRAVNGSPLDAAAQSNLSGTLSGQYLNAESNPYLSGALDAANRSTVRQFKEATMPGIQGSFAKSGRFGSNQYQNTVQGAQEALATGLADSNVKAYADQYNQERQRQMQATAIAPDIAAQDYKNIQALLGVGSAYDQQSQDLLNADIARYDFSNNAQRYALDEYINRLSGVGGGYGTTTGYATSPGARTSTFANALGGAATGAGLAKMLMTSANPWNMASYGAVGAGLGILGGLFN